MSSGTKKSSSSSSSSSSGDSLGVGTSSGFTIGRGPLASQGFDELSFDPITGGDFTDSSDSSDFTSFLMDEPSFSSLDTRLEGNLDFRAGLDLEEPLFDDAPLLADRSAISAPLDVQDPFATPIADLDFDPVAMESLSAFETIGQWVGEMGGAALDSVKGLFGMDTPTAEEIDKEVANAREALGKDADDDIVKVFALKSILRRDETRAALVLKGLATLYGAYQSGAERKEARRLRREEREFQESMKKLDFEQAKELLAMRMAGAGGGGGGGRPGGSTNRPVVSIAT